MQQVLFLISLETQNSDYPSVSLIFSSMDGLLQVHLSEGLILYLNLYLTLTVLLVDLNHLNISRN